MKPEKQPPNLPADSWYVMVTPRGHFSRISAKHRSPLCRYLNRRDQPDCARVIALNPNSELIRVLPTCQRC
jgi:hypothetical protein